MEFFKPGIDFNFLGKRKIFLLISALLIVISLISITVFKFNMGIDFKGGTKIIVAFKKDRPIERTKIKDILRNHFSNKIGAKGIQIEVQDFDVGGGGEENQKFLIFTDLSNLLTPLKKLEISNKIKNSFGKARVESSMEAGDKFFLTLNDEKPVAEVNEKIKKLFKNFGFETVDVLSDKEEKLMVEYYKEKNLIIAEKKKDEEIELLKLEKKLEEQKAKLVDNRYTIYVQEIQSMVAGLLKENFKEFFEDVLSTTTVSAAVGLELFQMGLLAILYAIIGILIYIAIRFDIRFSPGCVIALIHDVTITMGFLSLFQIKFSLPIVAAFLTIVGYSVNDTIVIYDRIRENIRKARFANLEKTMNVSLNETLSRTILTSGTTLLVVVALFIFGGGLIKDFALALIIGVILGTYSSIFVATPITLYLDSFFKRKSTV